MKQQCHESIKRIKGIRYSHLLVLQTFSSNINVFVEYNSFLVFSWLDSLRLFRISFRYITRKRKKERKKLRRAEKFCVQRTLSHLKLACRLHN